VQVKNDWVQGAFAKLGVPSTIWEHWAASKPKVNFKIESRLESKEGMVQLKCWELFRKQNLYLLSVVGQNLLKLFFLINPVFI